MTSLVAGQVSARLNNWTLACAAQGTSWPVVAAQQAQLKDYDTYVVEFLLLLSEQSARSHLVH